MSEGYAGDVLFSLGIPLLFYSELCGLRIYSLRIDFAIPISKPLNSANPRRRPMQDWFSSSGRLPSGGRGRDA